MNEPRAKSIRETVERIAQIEQELGGTEEALGRIKAELLCLASNRQWFTANEFPPPSGGASDHSRVYRLSEHEGTHGRALYIQSVRSPLNVPPHNHDTWAVIVGIQGVELNRFYERTDDGVNQTGSHEVRSGTGVALLPDDLHSIHINEDAPVLTFHMYGLGLEYLTERMYFDRAGKQWKLFDMSSNIIDARHLAA